MDDDQRVKVIMRSNSISPDGTPVTFEAIDWVMPDDLTAYVDDAFTRWQYVTTDASAQPPASVLDGGYTPITSNIDQEA